MNEYCARCGNQLDDNTQMELGLCDGCVQDAIDLMKEKEKGADWIDDLDSRVHEEER